MSNRCPDTFSTVLSRLTRDLNPERLQHGVDRFARFCTKELTNPLWISTRERCD